MLDTLQQLQWHQPSWLLLSLLPLGYVFFHYARARFNNHRLKQLASKPLLQIITIDTGKAATRSHPYLFTLGWLSASIALAGPYIANNSASALKDSYLNALDIAIVFDISPSMRSRDVYPNRIEAAKRALTHIVNEAPYNRYGLISFSANAYTVLPLTRDRFALQHFTEQLDPSLSNFAGSNLTRALELAYDMLEGKDTPSGKAILLFTDGETHESHRQALLNKVADKSIPIYPIGLGTLEGAPILNSDGRVLLDEGQTRVSKLNVTLLKRIANQSGGNFTLYNGPIEQLQTPLDALALKKQQQLSQQSHHSLHLQLFPVFIIVALCCFLLHALKNAPQAVFYFSSVFILSALYQTPAIASPWKEQDAFEFLKKGDYDSALTTYQQLKGYNAELGAGVAAYHQKDWPLAESHFKNALQRAQNQKEKAWALYNLGNTSVQQHNYEQAINDYENALAALPGFPAANHNLTLLHDTQALGGTRHDKQESDKSANNANKQENKTEGDGKGSDTQLNAALKQWGLKHNQAQEQRQSYERDPLQHVAEPDNRLLKFRIRQSDQDNVSYSSPTPW